MNGKIFLDSNVLVYGVSEDEAEKSTIARNLVVPGFFCTPQVVFEYMNVCRRKLGYSKNETIELANDLLRIAILLSENDEVVRKSLSLLGKFDFSFFDSKIVASALLSGCSVLYSEDLHHGLVIENKLHIVNPFLALNKQTNHQVD